jgi:cytochrome c-type biogenesis protein CcmH/NrfG
VETTGAAAHVARARALLSVDDPDGAHAAALDGVEADAGSGEAWHTLAQALRRLGRHAEAGEALQRAVQADPLDPEIRRALGFAMARRGDLAAALEHWEYFLRACPHAEEIEPVREAAVAARRLHEALEEHAYA